LKTRHDSNYHLSRSSGRQFVWIDYRTERTFYAVPMIIRMNSSEGHDQKRRPPRRRLDGELSWNKQKYQFFDTKVKT